MRRIALTIAFALLAASCGNEADQGNSEAAIANRAAEIEATAEASVAEQIRELDEEANAALAEPEPANEASPGNSAEPEQAAAR